MSVFDCKKLGPKDWGEELLVAHTPDYTGKVLTMRAGESGPLQYHVFKDETMHLWAGKAELTLAVDEKLTKQTIRAGQSFHVPPGTVHRVKALRTCIFFEASTPHFEDRVNVEDFYKDDPNL